MPKMLTADRAIDVLEAVVGAPDGLGTRQMARVLGLSVATVHNLAKTLEARGYLRQEAQTKRFRVGLTLMLMGRHDSYMETLATLARPHVEKVARELEESVMFGALDRAQVINLHYIPSRQALRVQEPENLRDIAHCTAMGKLMLAQMPDAALASYLSSTRFEQFTGRTIVDAKTLKAELVRIRKQGFSATEDELCEGVSAMAVAVRDRWGKSIAAIGASAPTIRMSVAAERERTRSALQAAAVEIEKAWASPNQK